MKIYKAEAHIKDLILNNKISFASQISPLIEAAAKLINSKNFASVLDKALKATSTENKQPDLFYFDSILATPGLVNLNDDYFHPAEAWAARHSPIDKQTNYMHNEKDIIGHMTGCFAINFDKTELLSDDLTIDDLPEKYHLVTSGVLYKKWEDPELQERMDDIIDRISKGELFVSMECLFHDFDYILFSKGSKDAEIVTRNQDTAFLTKFLRGFGGSGVYKSRQVGRLLKNIVFSGKGIVDTPANPPSIIFNEDQPLKIKATLEQISDNGELNQMAETKEKEIVTPNFDALEKQVASLTSALEAANKEKEQAKVEAEKQAKADMEKALADSKSALASKEDEIKTLKAQVEKAEADNKAVAEKLAQAEKDIQAKVAELDKIAAEQKTQKRIATLEKNGYSNDEAVALEKKFAKVDDEAFDAFAEMMGKKDKKDEKGKNDKSAANADIDVDENEDNADADALATAEAQKGVAGVIKDVEISGNDLFKKLTKALASQSELCQKHKKNSK